MDLRRFLNILFGHLTREIATAEAVEAFRADVLNAKFPAEMTAQERRRAEVRRRERELGIGGSRSLMDAFQFPPAARA